MNDFFDRRPRAWWPEKWSLPAALDIEPPVLDFYKEKDHLVVKVGTLFWVIPQSLELPSDVQAEKATASFKNGILEVRLARTEVAKPKEIKVAVEEEPTTSVG